MSATSPTPTPSTDWRTALTVERLLPGFTAGLVVTIINVSLGTAFANLVFAGQVSPAYLYDAIGFILMGTIVMGLLMTLSSSFPTTIAGPQDGPAVILALLASEIAITGNDEMRFFTLVALIILGTLITGVTFWLLGHFQLGNLVRYVPYSVMGGFLAGTGLLLLRGGISITAGVPVDFDNLSALGESDVLKLWLPAAVFAVVLFGISLRYNHRFLIPGGILLAVAVFYYALVMTGTSIDEATAGGWLLEGISGDAGALWKPIVPGDLESVEWGEMLHQLPGLVAVAMVSALATLLNLSGLELTTGDDLDMNRELKGLGVANGVSGLFGSTPGYHKLSSTTLVYKISGLSRVPGIVTSLVMLAVVLVGGALIGYLPQLVLGGLLVLLGLDFLYDWAYKVYHELRLSEYGIIAVIALAINAAGFLEGVGLGLMFAVILFVLDYSRTPVVYTRHDGNSYHSNVVRSIQYEEYLQHHGQQVLILRLHGFLFFGTAHHLVNDVRQRTATVELPPLRYVILDFDRVTGLDSSAIIDFSRMVQLAQTRDQTLIFTALSPEFVRVLQPRVLSWEGCRQFSALDYGVAWVEDQAIAEYEAQGLFVQRLHIPLTEQLDSIMPLIWAQRLMEYMEREEAEAGQILIRQGEPSPGVLFVEEGQVTVQLEGADGSVTRIRTMHQGALIGEVGVYLDQPATATVVADVPCMLFRMTAKNLKQLEKDDPAVAGGFHRFMAQFLARRLSQTTDTLSNFVN